MRKFFQAVIAVKASAAMNFTAAMCVYLVFLALFRQTAAPLSTLFSLLLASAAAGALQVAAFSNLFIKKLAYGWRMAVFAVPFGAVLAGLAAGFGWFPKESAGAWALFWVLFLVIFLGITAGIELYYRLSGRKYDDRLDWYRRNRERD